MKMSSLSLESELSSAELRSKLFHSFKSKGVIQSIKTQLRKQLALELHEKAISANIINRENNKYDGSLFQRICNSLFLDHLKRSSFDYTLSVFITESHSCLEDAIPLHDILELLHINVDSKLYKALSKICIDDKDMKGFLWSFIVAIAQEHGHPATEKSIQTDPHESSPNLDKKLFEIEKSQLEKIQSSIRNNYDSVEAKILAFQRRYEMQKHDELKSELEGFRASELAAMRVAEREKCQKEFQEMKVEYQKRYDLRLKDLERRELEINDKASRQEKAVEKEGYEQRQKILEEMETLKQRDLELKRNHKSAMTAVEIEEGRLRSREEQCKQKEKSIQEMEEQYENKLKHEVLRIKLELQEKDIEQVAAMEVREQQLREEKMNFLSQKDVYMKWKEEADRLREENERLNNSVVTAKQAYDSLSQKYEKVSEQYKQVSSYGDIKNENMIMQKELEISKKSISDLSLEKAQMKKEHQKLVRDLLNKINSPDQENEMKTLQDLERSATLKYEALQNQHELLKKSYMIQVKKNEELWKLYENNLLSQRELLRECDELKLQLHFTNQEKGTPILQQNDESKPPTSSSRAAKDVKSVNLLNTICLLPTHDIAREDWSPSIDIQESTNVLQKLEQEALELEKSYKQFQERQMSIKSQLPLYVEKTKTPQTMSVTCSNHDILQDVTPAHVNVMMKSDSFDLSHLIPSRGMTESNDGRNISKYSTSTPLDNQSTVMKKPLSTSELFEQKKNVSISLVNSQLDSALSRLEGTSSDYIARTSTRKQDLQGINPLPNVEKVPENRTHIYSASMYDTVSTRSRYDTLAAKSVSRNSVNHVPVCEANIVVNSTSQLPLTETIPHDEFSTQLSMKETIKPIHSLTQMPLVETILPVNSLSQLPLNESSQQRDSLTQLPLMETMQPKNTFSPPCVATSKPVDSLTQLPYVETMQTMDLLTQLPLLETPFPITTTETLTAITQPKNSLLQIPLSGTAAPNASLTQFTLEETKNNFVTMTPHAPTEQIIRTQIAKKMNDDNIHSHVIPTTSTATGLDQTGVKIESSESLGSNNSNTQNEEFDSKNDIFKTSNFMLKGLQSTRIAGDELPKPAKAIKSTLMETEEKTLLRHSTPDMDKSSGGESMQNISGKPLQSQSSIRKENASADSSNIISGPFDSEENARDSKKGDSLLKRDWSMEQTLSEGEVDHANGKSEGEISHAIDGEGGNCQSEGEIIPPPNPMEQYMQIILEKRKADPGAKEKVDDQADVQHAVHEDVPLSEIEEKNEESEPSNSNSEFEW